LALQDDKYDEEPFESEDEPALPTQSDALRQLEYDRDAIMWREHPRSWLLGIPNPLLKFWVQHGRLYRGTYESYMNVKAHGKRGARGETDLKWRPHYSRESVLLYKIQDTSVVQRPLGQLLNIGTVTIISFDKSMPSLVLENIKYPMDFCDWLDEIVACERILNNVQPTEIVPG
jgi:hypothetical protein